MAQDVLTPGEVALVFRVSPKTVTRWAKSGVIPSFTTPGGHHRFHREVIEILATPPKQTGVASSATA